MQRAQHVMEPKAKALILTGPVLLDRIKDIYDQLKYFQQGDRENALMMAVVPYLKSLSDDQLLDIAAFYSSNISTVGQAKDDAELLNLGESLYRAGDLERGIPACTACHSVNGAGNAQANFPRVSGQQKGYLITSLKSIEIFHEMRAITLWLCNQLLKI